MAPTRYRTSWPRRLRVLQWSSLALLGLCLLLVVVIRYAPAPDLYPSLPRLTHTAQGADGDPLNILLIGSQVQITASFTQARWRVPDPITPVTSARIAAASLTHQPYPTAPVSTLYVFGRPQDLAFEWPTGDAQNRGHIRLWLTTLRLDGSPVWLGQASYDHGIEVSGTATLPTHHISPAVDLERDTVGTNLQRTGLVSAIAEDPFTAPILAAYNGGGDYYTSDGNVLVIQVTPVPAPLSAPSGFAALLTHMRHALFHAYAVVLTTPPLLVLVSVVVSVLLILAVSPLVSSLLGRLRR